MWERDRRAVVLGVVGGRVAFAEVSRGWAAEDWFGWDETVRNIGRGYGQVLPSRRELFGDGDKDEDGDAPGRVERLAIALCHPNGYVRERALVRAAGERQLTALVAVRCSDWVAPVRRRAREVLREQLTVSDAVTLADLLLRLGERARGEFGAGLLQELVGRGLFGELLGAPERRVRRYAYRRAVDERWLTAVELAAAAARDPDAVVQMLCADAALRDVTEGDAEDVLRALLRARNSRARSAGVTALRRLGRGERAREFLVDRSGVVRACARYVVRKDGHEPHALYRELCAADEVAPGAVIGLAECGAAGDAATLWEFTAHAQPAVRARAVAGLRVLDLAVAERLLPLVDDEAPGVVREVAVALVPGAARLPVEWLMERVAPHRARCTRRAAFRLLAAMGGMTELHVSVSLLHDEDERLRHWAGQSVRRWMPGADVPRGDAEVGALLDRSAHLFSGYALKRRKWAAGIRA